MRKLNACLSVACLCLVAYGCASPVDTEAEVGSESEALLKGRLLALGDSIAFGYDPFGDFTKDKNFEGYPELLAESFSVRNAACPGETSGSLISATAPDNGCRAYRSRYPLHATYGDKPTQLDYALSRLTSKEAEDIPTLITLNVAGNDIFLLQARCASDPRGYAVCFGEGAPGLIGSVASNVATILQRIRATGYQGGIVFMTLYSVDYTDPSTLAFLGALNGATANTARAFGARIADAYGAFQAAAGSQSPCAAGLLIPKPTGGCDVHPSALGADILAQAVRTAQ